jgi:hypothetical protein
MDLSEDQYSPVSYRRTRLGDSIQASTCARAAATFVGGE